MAVKISVVIPLYNHEQYIEQAIESVFEQGVDNVEIVIVNDGSSDGSEQVVKKMMDRYPEIKYFFQENKGAHVAINNGIKHSSGEYVAILNSDDVFHPERFRKILEIFDKGEGVDAVFTGIDFIDGEGECIENKWYVEAKKCFEESGVFVNSLVNGNFFMTTSNLFIKRELFDQIGVFSNLRYTHDLDFFLRLFCKGKKVEYLDEPLMYYRFHGNNTISEGALKVKMEVAAVVAFHIAEFSENLDVEDEVELKKLTGLYEILEKQNLLRYVTLFVQFYLSLSDSSNYYEALWRDEKFTKYILQTIE
jgi:glycosyltransferase involved in cell wall biosynthesis